jgi:C4-dicarboxylate-binding protein DctP
VLAAKKAEVLPMSKADTAKWRAAMKPVWKRFEDEIGKDLIKAAQGENM